MKLFIFSALIFTKWKSQVFNFYFGYCYSENSPNRNPRKQTALLKDIHTKLCFSQLPYKIFIFTFPLVASSSYEHHFCVPIMSASERASTVQVVAKGWIFKCGKPEILLTMMGHFWGTDFIQQNFGTHFFRNCFTSEQNFLCISTKLSLQFNSLIYYFWACANKKFSSYTEQECQLQYTSRRVNWVEHGMGPMQHLLTTTTPFNSQKFLFKARALGSNLIHRGLSTSQLLILDLSSPVAWLTSFLCCPTTPYGLPPRASRGSVISSKIIY